MIKTKYLLAFAIFLMPKFMLSDQIDLIDTSNHADFKFGVNLTLSSDNYFYALQPNITLDYKEHSFLLSPKFNFYTDVPIDNFLQGFDLAYKIFPNQRIQRFDFYFIADIGYTVIQHSEQRNYKNDDNAYQSIYKHSLNYWGFTVGYGFCYKIKSLYFDFSIGLGMGLYSEDYNLEVPDFPSASYNETGNNALDFAKIYKIGIGYNF
jgi:hypothetical protein